MNNRKGKHVAEYLSHCFRDNTSCCQNFQVKFLIYLLIGFQYWIDAPQQFSTTVKASKDSVKDIKSATHLLVTRKKKVFTILNLIHIIIHSTYNKRIQVLLQIYANITSKLKHVKDLSNFIYQRILEFCINNLFKKGNNNLLTTGLHSNTSRLPKILQKRDQAEMRYEVCGSSAGRPSPFMCPNSKPITSMASSTNFSWPTANPVEQKENNEKFKPNLKWFP